MPSYFELSLVFFLAIALLTFFGDLGLLFKELAGISIEATSGKLMAVG